MIQPDGIYNIDFYSGETYFQKYICFDSYITSRKSFYHNRNNAIIRDNEKVILFDITNKSIIKTISPFCLIEYCCEAVTISLDGKIFGIYTNDCQIFMYDIDENLIFNKKIKEKICAESSIFFSPNNSKIYLCDEKILLTIDISSGKELLLNFSDFGISMESFGFKFQ